MIRNYLKTAIRHFLKQKSYSFINVLGLSIGLATFIILLVFILHELSYDNFHENADNIYRVSVKDNNDFSEMALSSGPMGQALLEDFPEVINYTRLRRYGRETLVNYKEKRFYEKFVFYADSNFFDIFSFKLLRGNAQTALSEPNTIVLTERLAKKYFGKQNPMGQTIRLNNQNNFLITGIMEDFPTNSHMGFNALVSLPTIENAEYLKGWDMFFVYTYILIRPDSDYKKLQTKFPDFRDRHMIGTVQAGYNFELILQPLKKIYLHSNLSYEIQPNGDLKYIYIFSAIAFFILLIACINYMNLASARSFKRAKEVGMRKIHGAVKTQLAKQFIMESVVFSIIALILALLIVKIAAPYFNDLIFTNTSINITEKAFSILPALIALTIIIGILAGAYPALYLSSFSPLKVLKGEETKGKKKSVLRNLLIVLQFSIATGLIISSLLIYKQLNYLNSNDNLGYNKKNIVVIPLRTQQAGNKTIYLKNEYMNLPFIDYAASGLNIPGHNEPSHLSYLPEGNVSGEEWMLYSSYVDDNFINALEIKIIKGRNFSQNYGLDSASVLINKSLQKKLGWENPIGKTIQRTVFGNTNFKIIGVMKDFHFQSLQKPIEPMILEYLPDYSRNLILKLRKGDTQQQLAQIKNKWEELLPDTPFEYFFLDKQYESQYASYNKMGKLFVIFTFIAIFIACLGLFGMASFLTELRTKEIGIRKVNGASIAIIMQKLNKEFLQWVLLANILAWPLTYYFMDKWLQNFAYRIDMDISYFAIGAIISLVIAFITVSYHSYTAAARNPIESLRVE